MDKTKRNIIVPVFAAILALGAFSSTVGAENVRNVQILSLLAAGFGLGVGFTNFMNRKRKETGL